MKHSSMCLVCYRYASHHTSQIMIVAVTTEQESPAFPQPGMNENLNQQMLS